MPSPTSELAAGTAPTHGTSGRFEAGLRYEQAGVTQKAANTYSAALADSRCPLARAEAHLRIARVHRAESNWNAAIAESRAAVLLAEAGGSDDLVAEAMNVEVGVYQLRGDFPRGEALAAAALDRARAPRVRGILLQNRGAIAAQMGNFGAASDYFVESVDAFRESGYELGMVFALNNASAASRDHGEPAVALAYARRAAVLARRLNATDMLTLAAQNQAHALVLLGQADEAESHLGEALGHYTATANLLRQAECLEVMGMIQALRDGDGVTAERCFARALTIAELAGAESLAARIDDRLTAIRNGGDGAPPPRDPAAPRDRLADVQVPLSR